MKLTKLYKPVTYSTFFNEFYKWDKKQIFNWNINNNQTFQCLSVIIKSLSIEKYVQYNVKH